MQDDPWQVRKTVSVLRASTSLSAVVSPPGVVTVGTPVTVTFVEANDGVVQLQDVSVTSAQCDVTPTLGGGGFNQGDVNGNGLLDPGESWIYTCTLVPGGSLTVTGEGSGRLVGSALVIDSSNDPDESASVSVQTPPPPEPPVDTPPVGDDPIPEDDPEDDPPTEVIPVGEDPIPNPPGGLPSAGSGGLATGGGSGLGISLVAGLGLVALMSAFVLRRVAGRGGARRG